MLTERPSEGETGVQHGHRTRGRDMRRNRNHVQILPGSSDDARLINASWVFCNIRTTDNAPRAFSSEADTGSRQENASNQESRVRFDSIETDSRIENTKTRAAATSRTARSPAPAR